MTIERRACISTPHGSSGFTLIETLLSLAVMVTALLAFAQAVVTSSRAATASREATFASEAARQLLDDMLAADFDDVFALYNADPADDPGGAGTAPGATLAVEGLSAMPSDADGAPGEIVFPSAGSVLREDGQDVVLGMPRDLNGDGLVDDQDHAADYELLPVLVRIRWRGVAGDSKVEYKTILGAML